MISKSFRLGECEHHASGVGIEGGRGHHVPALAKHQFGVLVEVHSNLYQIVPDPKGLAGCGASQRWSAV